MKLILSKTIVEVDEISFATVGLHTEDSYSTEDVEFARNLLSMPLWLRVFTKIKYAIFGQPKPFAVPASKCYKITIEYGNSKGKFTVKLTYNTEREAVEEFAVVKEFAKRLENKHAMDIISK